jgi:protein MpaA
VKYFNIAFMIVTFFLSGCARPHKLSTDTPGITSTHETLSALAVNRYIVGTSVENRQIECLVIGEGKDVVLIIASIHGSESAGTPLVLRLVKHLQQHPHLLQCRKVVLLPVANPDGVFYNSRYNARGVDLNRNFPGANRHNDMQFGQRAFSEPETSIIDQLIRQYKPNRAVSLHQPVRFRVQESMRPQLQEAGGWIDYDGPGKDLAERMAEYSKLPVYKFGTRLGSLGYYAGESLGIPIITFEQPTGHGGFNSNHLWEQYGAALVAAVVYPDRVKMNEMK